MSTIEEGHRCDGGYTDYPVVQYSYQAMGQAYQEQDLPGPKVGGSGAQRSWRVILRAHR